VGWVGVLGGILRMSLRFLTHVLKEGGKEVQVVYDQLLFLKMILVNQVLIETQ